MYAYGHSFPVCLGLIYALSSEKMYECDDLQSLPVVQGQVGSVSTCGLCLYEEVCEVCEDLQSI